MTTPIADFVASPLVGFIPLTVDFTDASTGSIDSYEWSFGDPASGPSNTSTLQNPSHTYNDPGEYTVELTVTNMMGSDTETKVEYINVLAIVELFADFVTTDIRSSGSGIEVSFEDRSVVPPGTSFFWEFGDTNTSNLQNPVHTYSTPGVYEVSLTVTFGPFSNQICKSVAATTQIPRYMEIWGTVNFIGGIPVEADKIIHTALGDGTDCELAYTDTFRTYRTVDDSGTVRFVVRARGDFVGIPNSGFADGEEVRLFIGGRQATDANGDPITVPFYQTLPSNSDSHIEVAVVYAPPMTIATPSGGTFGNRPIIELTSNVVPSTIYYTIDGTDPTTSGTRIQYTGPFELSEGTTELKFFTEDPLGPDEEVKTETYVVEQPLPVPSLIPSDYSSNQEITLVGNRPGTIYFSVNGSSFAQYTGQIIEANAGPDGTGTTTIQAYLNDTINSLVGPTQTFTYNIDLVRPVITSFTINNGDATTANQLVTLQIDASSYTNSVTGLLISEQADFTGATVQLYAPEVTFELSPVDELKTIYIQVSDQLEQFSSVKQEQITLDTTPPTITVSTEPMAPIGESTFEFAGTKSAGSGVVAQVTNDTDIEDEVLIVPIDDSTMWAHTFALKEGVNSIKFQAITQSQTRSTAETRTVEIILIPQGVTEATTITDVDGNWRIPYVLLQQTPSSNNFALIAEASFGPDPVIIFPQDNSVLNQKIITVSGTADPGSIITLSVLEA